MTQTPNEKEEIKCPYCPCIFFTQADLQAHMTNFGSHKGEHEYQYNKTHGRLEHGVSDE